jgi:hypothetical protein
MSRSATSAGRARAGSGSAARVVIPTDLKKRVAAEAKRRGLELAPAVRLLLAERVDELEDAARLSRAEEWQRAEAWATWERMKAGDVREASQAQIDLEFEAARAQVASP